MEKSLIISITGKVLSLVKNIINTTNIQLTIQLSSIGHDQRHRLRLQFSGWSIPRILRHGNGRNTGAIWANHVCILPVWDGHDDILRRLGG